MKLTFKIGPVIILVKADEPPVYQLPPVYRAFEYTGDERPTLTIRVRRELAPRSQNRKLLGELKGDWRLYSEGDFFRLEIMNSVKKAEPKTVALINPAWDEIDCQPPFLPDPLDPLSVGWGAGDILETLFQWWWAGCGIRQGKGFLVHSSAISWHGQAMAFIGPSGAGKTTISQLFENEPEATLLNDERTLFWKNGEIWYVSGTPWPGMLGKASSLSAPLARFFILKKGGDNRFETLPSSAIIRDLVPECFVPLWDEEGMKGFLGLIHQLIQEVRGGELEFKKDPTIIDYLRQEMAVFQTNN